MVLTCYFVAWLQAGSARSAFLLHYRFRFAPVSAASSLLARCNANLPLDWPLLRSPLPFGAVAPLRIKAFYRFRCLSARLPNPPDSLSLPAAGSFSSRAADQRSWFATFPEACCSSNLLEPHSLCSPWRFTSTLFWCETTLFPQYLFDLFSDI